ncbi:MAG: hypothetical protein PHX70_06090 [Clostridium sp.]|nr:hypothetical protein [Clostridium sp.]
MYEFGYGAVQPSLQVWAVKMYRSSVIFMAIFLVVYGYSLFRMRNSQVQKENIEKAS